MADSYGAVAGHIGRIPNFSKQNNCSQPSSYEPPACIQNAMMTKDKKPFTYTPGGLDLSQIKTPSMARRYNNRPDDEAMYNHQQPSNGVQGGPPKPPPPPPQGPAPPPPPPPLVIQAPQAKSPKPQLGERPEIVIPENPIGMLRRTNSPYHWEQEKAEREKQGAKFVEKGASPVFQNTLAPTSFTQQPPKTYAASPQQNQEYNRVPDSPVHRPEPKYAPPQFTQPKPQQYTPPAAPPNLNQNQWKQPMSPPVQQQSQWSHPSPISQQNQWTQPSTAPQPNQWSQPSPAAQPNQWAQPSQAPQQNQWSQPSPVPHQSQWAQQSPAPSQNNYTRQLMSPPTVQSSQQQWNQPNQATTPTYYNQQKSEPQQRFQPTPQPTQNNNNQRPTTVHQNNSVPQSNWNNQQAQNYNSLPRAPPQTQAATQKPVSPQNWRQASLDTEEPQVYTGISQNPWKQQDSRPNQQQVKPAPAQIANQNRPQEPPKPNHISWKQPVQETKNYVPNVQQQNYNNNSGKPTPNERIINVQYQNGNQQNFRPHDSNNNYQQSRNVQPESFQSHITVPVKPRAQPSPQQNREVVYVNQEPVYYCNPEPVPPPFIKKKEKTPPPEWVHIADSRRSIPRDNPVQRIKSPEPEWVNKSRRSVPRDLMSPPPQNPQPVWSSRPSDNSPQSNVRVLPIQIESQNSSRGNQNNNQPQMRIVLETRGPAHINQPTDVLLSKVSSPHMVRLDDIMPAGQKQSNNHIGNGNAQPKTRIIPIQIESNGPGGNKSVYKSPSIYDPPPRQSKAFRVLQTITGTADNDELLRLTQDLPYTDF